MSGSAFFDTNVALYLLSADETKASRAEDVLAAGGTISVQVLNEFVTVARLEIDAPWAVIDEVLGTLERVCRVVALDLDTQHRALALAKRHGLPIYDATIAASALLAGCKTLYSEDFQHGRSLEGLAIVNPFR